MNEYKNQSNGEKKPLESDLQAMIAEADLGGREPRSKGIAAFLFYTALAWSLFQLYVASPLVLEFSPWMNEDVVKRFHLIFAGFLAFLSYPAFKHSPRHRIPLLDWGLAMLIAASALYLIVFKDALADRMGAPTQMDVIVSLVGILLLLEATRRSLGPPLMVVAIVFVSYALFGQYMPDMIAHKGASLNKAASHYWLTTEGAFGVAIGVSATMVFMFVLFGALLERAGAGNYFIRVAFAMMGHFRGGPAKAAVVSSAMTGMISGSSIANVVTTGTFTIPLMKRVGFPAEKSGAVEVASSTNGQLTPPIMGAAAFLMVEYVGIPFVEVIKHAFLPAVISYIALIYIVHLEAMKAGMQGLPRTNKMDKMAKLIGILSVVIVLGFLVWVLPPLLNFVKSLFGDAAPWAITVLLLVGYLGLIAYASRVPDLPHDHEINELPEVGPTVKSGLHYLLPVVVLVWLLTVERLSPGLSAFWATLFMIFIVITQKPLLDVFRKSGHYSERLAEGFQDLLHGLVNGARNMIGIGVATAAAGLIVGTVTLTGIGQVMVEVVEFISGGNIFLILLFTAVISLILGMGLPTTANYIVVSSLMAQVIVSLGAQSDIAIPLIAAHMFVFYFGILADDTPPVGLAAFAAAAISRGDPIRTGLQGFAYDIRTAILPFFFVFNTQLLMIGIDSWLDFVLTVISAVIAMLLFAAATQGYWLVKSRFWETLGLLLVAFILFRPGAVWDKVQDPYEELPGMELYSIADGMKEGDRIRFVTSGMTMMGDEKTLTLTMKLGAGETGKERLSSAGLETSDYSGIMQIDYINESSRQMEAIKKTGVDYGWEITTVQKESDRLPKQIMIIPALLLMGFIAWLQLRRRKQATTAAAV
ncbi:MAG: TRAP transporter permease [Chromatiales bacterium]